MYYIFHRFRLFGASKSRWICRIEFSLVGGIHCQPIVIIPVLFNSTIVHNPSRIDILDKVIFSLGGQQFVDVQVLIFLIVHTLSLIFILLIIYLLHLLAASVLKIAEQSLCA